VLALFAHSPKCFWRSDLSDKCHLGIHVQNTAQLNIPNYRQAATTLYEQKNRLPRAAQDALFRQPLEQILDLPAPQLEQWVIRGHKYYNQQMKAAKKQETLSTYDIRNYFTTRINQSDDLQPP